ncbi:MAG: hypothetical protein E7666_02905 [Ruminococcaceae bacterium]|nr:hypothetical protein [Oscillospiraceae bacterium]
MKIVKHFSLLIVLAILVTVGGVYAQWVFEDHDFVGGESNNIDISMQAYINPGNQQGYFYAKYVNLQVSVSDNYDGAETVAPETPGDYIADLSGAGSMVFLFKAYDQTTTTDMANLKFNVTFEEHSPIKYVYGEGVSQVDIPIFKYTPASGKTLTPITTQVEAQALADRYQNLDVSVFAELENSVHDPVWYYIELDYHHLFEEDIDNSTAGTQTHIDFTDEFKGTKIDNLEKWDVLQEAILAGSVTVYITDSRQPAQVSN